MQRRTTQRAHYGRAGWVTASLSETWSCSRCRCAWPGIAAGGEPPEIRGWVEGGKWRVSTVVVAWRGARKGGEDPRRQQVTHFCEELERSGSAADWQVRQAEQALRLYFVNFLDRGDWHSRQASRVVDGHRQTSPLAALEELRRHVRIRHYSYRTECTYVDWVRRFLDYLAEQQGSRTPRVDSASVRDYLTSRSGSACQPAPRTRRSARSCSRNPVRSPWISSRRARPESPGPQRHGSSGREQHRAERWPRGRPTAGAARPGCSRPPWRWRPLRLPRVGTFGRSPCRGLEVDADRGATRGAGSFSAAAGTPPRAQPAPGRDRPADSRIRSVMPPDRQFSLPRSMSRHTRATAIRQGCRCAWYRRG
jgi:hypothetical protein